MIVTETYELNGRQFVRTTSDAGRYVVRDGIAYSEANDPAEFGRTYTGANRLRDGQKCLLRNNMLHTYYKHRENRTIRQYEYENFEMEYKAYKALKGNSFIDRIYSEIKEYEIVS